MSFLISHWKKGVAGIMMALMVGLVPVSAELTPHKAEAQTGCIGAIVGGLGLTGLFGLLTVPVNPPPSWGQFFIDCVLNPLAWYLAKRLIAKMADEIVEWIQDGFNGYPAFISDPGGFMLDVADTAAGDYFFSTSSPFNFICSPFRLDIQIPLILSYYRPRGGEDDSGACKLSEAWANSTDFLAFTMGDFTSGGWSDWFDLVARPENNPYSSYLDASTELSMRVGNARGGYEVTLEWGRGFFSMEDPETGEMVTPGTFVESQVQGWVGDTNLDQLELADSLDEVLYALGEQLVSMVLQSGSGLLGLSRNNPEYGSLRNNMRNFGECARRVGSLIRTIEQSISDLELEPASPERDAALADLEELLAQANALTNTNPPPSDCQAQYADLEQQYQDVMNEVGNPDDGGTPPPPQPPPPEPE